MARIKHEPLTAPTIRRNWGYWDGRTAYETRRFPSWSGMDAFCRNHFDAMYASGFRDGWEGACEKWEGARP